MQKDTEQIHNILKTNTLPHSTDGGKEPEISYSDYIDPEVIGTEGEKVSGTFVCAHRYAGQPQEHTGVRSAVRLEMVK